MCRLLVNICIECSCMVPCDYNIQNRNAVVFFAFDCEFDGGLNLVQMSEESNFKKKYDLLLNLLNFRKENSAE